MKPRLKMQVWAGEPGGNGHTVQVLRGAAQSESRCADPAHCDPLVAAGRRRPGNEPEHIRAILLDVLATLESANDEGLS